MRIGRKGWIVQGVTSPLIVTMLLSGSSNLPINVVTSSTVGEGEIAAVSVLCVGFKSS